MTFLQTPLFAWQAVADRGALATGHPFLLFVILMGAWISNFSVFFKMPYFMALIAILLPWLPYICFFHDMVGLLPFYPWAVGITFIYLSKSLKPWHNKSAEPS
jgi:hypothetical protein